MLDLENFVFQSSTFQLLLLKEVSIFADFVEELSFPTIFCGDKRPSNTDRFRPLKISDIFKSELRQRDRRSPQNIGNIFFKDKKLQMKQIQDKMWIS